MKRWLALLAWLATATAAHAEWTAINLPRTDVTLRAVSIEGPDRFIVSGSSGTVAITGVGGRYWRFTPMLNWYLSDHVRLELAYGYGSLDRFGVVGKTQFFQTRLQLQL